MIPYNGKSRSAVNVIKTVFFDSPEWTPCTVSIMPATWMKYREDIEEIVLAHPRVFPGYTKGSRDFDYNPNPLYQPGFHTDCWGCVWENIEKGLDGMVVEHPLENWSALESWKPPDPLTDGMFGPRPSWDEVEKQMEEAKAAGRVAQGWPLPHGFFYMLLYYLRGFDNFMMDMATQDPRLEKLIDIIETYNVTVISKYMDCGAEMIYVGEDLGLQKSLPISPDMWRKFIKPSYEKMLGQCRDRNIPVRLHSDGNILEIIPDLIDVGVCLLNPQIRANGLEGLVETARGKVALDQDLDRQLFPFATPSEIEDHIGEVHEGLYDPRGGLLLHAECEPDVPLENVDAICTALEEVCDLPPAAPA